MYHVSCPGKIKLSFVSEEHIPQVFSLQLKMACFLFYLLQIVHYAKYCIEKDLLTVSVNTESRRLFIVS